jgi:hypothetical protein
MNRWLALLFVLLIPFVACGQVTYNYPHDAWGGNTNLPCTNPAWPPATTSNPDGSTTVFRLSISAISRTSNIATVTVSSTASLATGAGIVISSVADNSFNTVALTTVPSAGPTLTILNGTQFTYPNTGANGSSSGGSASPANWYFQQQAGAAPQPKYWCSPAGNHKWLIGVTAGECPNGGTKIFATKYGSSVVTAENDCIAFLTANGFTGLGDQFKASSDYAISSINFTDTPQYSTSNLSLEAGDATHDWRQIISPVFNTLAGNAREGNPIGCIDYFAPQFAVFNQNWLASQDNFSKLSSYRMGITVGGSDTSACSANGPDFDSFPVTHQSSRVGYLALTASPIQTWNNQTNRGGTFLYADPINYTKALMVSPPTTCSGTVPRNGSVVAPCSIATMLTKKYGTVGALNSQWGSTYTTLGSSGICLGYGAQVIAQLGCGSGAALSVGTGNGSTLIFSIAGHANTDPFSVQILVNGIVVAGDCPPTPQFVHGCSGSAGIGSISGVNISGGTINYSTGALTVIWTGGHAPTGPITANLVFGGWPKNGPGGGGTGLLDEDGSGSWMGNNAICLLAVAGGGPGTTSYACRFGNPGNYDTTINANQNFAADMQIEWEREFFGQGFSTIRSGMKAANPHSLYGSPETTGNWGAPPFRSVLEACNLYCDWLYAVDNSYNSPDAPTRTAITNYYTKYFTGPMLSGMLRTSCPDSALANDPGGGNTLISCQGSAVFSPNQVARGLEYYNSVNQMLTTPSFNNTILWVGLTWWQLNDCDQDFAKPNNWGLKSCGPMPVGACTGSGKVNCAVTNNAYDGREAVSSVLACSPPSASFNCGLEPDPGTSPVNAVRPFGNLLGGLTGVKAANFLWLGAPTPPVPSAPQVIIGGNQGNLSGSQGGIQ